MRAANSNTPVAEIIQSSRAQNKPGLPQMKT